MSVPSRPEAWIGLAELRTDDQELLPGAAGAYAQVIAMAPDEVEFHRQVRTAALELGFEVVAIEEIESLESRLEDALITPLLESLRKAALASGTAAFGTFHSFPEEDEEENA